MSLTSGKIQIIHEHGQPAGIRDKTGYLLQMNPAHKYSSQEERYKEDCEHNHKLAEFILNCLIAERANSESTGR